MVLSRQTGWRIYGIVGCVACAVAVTLGADWVSDTMRLDGPLLDALLWARAEVFPAQESASDESPVVVIALDQRSLDDPEFQAYPRALFAPVWASLLEGLMAVEPQAVGFDFLLSYSANRFSPDFDVPFLTALARYRNRIVLARSATTLPATPFLAALGFDEGALGMAELLADADGTYRRVPASLIEEQSEAFPSLAQSLLRRAGAAPMTTDVLLTPRRHLETIPTYALIDVLHCGRSAPEVVASAFRGKIVLIGTTLAEEDRKRAPARYLPQPRQDFPPLHPCGLRRLGASVPQARTVPGVYLHAAAIEAVVRDQVVSTVPRWVVATLTAGTAATGSWLALWLTPWMTGLGLLGTTFVLFAVATDALQAEWWLPLALPFLALGGAAAVAYLVRYLIEERSKRQIQHAFSHYLAPTIVEQLARNPSSLKLGGERREITVMFADLSGFTQLSTRVPPEVLTSITNRYLGYMVQEVEATGGYVNQFLGDAVMAIWGAPVPDPQHAVHAVRAARGLVSRVMEAKAAADAKGEPGYTVKVGLNAGSAIVGNVGTDHRYNYTAIGETVNVAARLESVPTLYACRIVIGPEVAKLVKDEFLLRELDRIVVKGKDEPITVYEPIALLAEATPAQREIVQRYAEALSLYRAKRFAEAAQVWDQVAALETTLISTSPGQPTYGSNPSAHLAVRARQFAATLPGEQWTGAWVLSGK